MNDEENPSPLSRYVEELIECGVQLAAILDHMLRHESPDPSVPRPADVLRDLVVEVLEPAIGSRTRDIENAADLLMTTSQTIESEFFLVDPEHDEPEGLNGASHEGRMH